MDNDLEKKSIRDNVVEKRRCALQIATLNAACRVVAVDIRKRQNEMRRRLQKYRDRQREISNKRDGPLTITMDEFLERQIRLKKLTTAMDNRPYSSPIIKRMSKLISESDIDAESFNMDAFTDRRRSRVDLRPCTAVTCPSRMGHPPRRGTNIANGKKDVKYYEDEEIRDRSVFYSQLLNIRKQQEQDKFKDLGAKVNDFCGKQKSPAEGDTWRPMGSAMSQYSNSKYNKSWVKPPRPVSSQSQDGTKPVKWDERSRRVSTAPSARMAWAEHNIISES